MKLLSSFHGHPCYSCAGARSRDACQMPRPGFSFTRTRRLAASLYNTGGARALHCIATKRESELRSPCFKTSTLEVCSDHGGLKHDTEDYVQYLTVDRRGMRCMFIRHSPGKIRVYLPLARAAMTALAARGSRRRRRRLAGGLGLSRQPSPRQRRRSAMRAPVRQLRQEASEIWSASRQAPGRRSRDPPELQYDGPHG